MQVNVESLDAMKTLGAQIGTTLRGGEVLELVGDIGTGKTSFTKGLALGLGIDEDVQSPSFTISRTYDARDGLRLVHYDFYRLSDPGIMANELANVLEDLKTIVVVEWADVARDILPKERLTIHFSSPTEATRQLHFDAKGLATERILEAIR